MEFMTTIEAAKLWGISSRRVALLCEQGRIDGVKKAGIVWLIPPDAKKPKDARIKDNKANDQAKRLHKVRESK